MLTLRNYSKSSLDENMITENEATRKTINGVRMKNELEQEQKNVEVNNGKYKI